eukprot:2511961-Pyramimonas_sp.AAC.2
MGVWTSMTTADGRGHLHILASGVLGLLGGGGFEVRLALDIRIEPEAEQGHAVAYVLPNGHYVPEDDGAA